jgi:hypothetical protein
VAPQESPALTRQVRVIPIPRPEIETTGAPPSDQMTQAGQQPKAALKQSQCNQKACSRTYRSFDEATCTYQPGRGGPRRLCES